MVLTRILELFGLVKIKDVRDLVKQPYTGDELDSMYIETAYKRAEGWDKDKYHTMLDLLKKNRELAQFLDWTISEDVKRSFNVTEAERPVVRGAVSRTRYLRSLCMSDANANEVMNKRITRYAK